jgi:transcriptional adapter 3
MPPTSKSKAKAQAKDRHSRSRNTTPTSITSSVPQDTKADIARHTIERSTSPYLHTSLHHPEIRGVKLSNNPISDILDNSTIPTPKELGSYYNTIKRNILDVLRTRDEACDQMMRELALKKKERAERTRAQELENAKLEAEKQRLQSNNKKSNRPLAVGAHTVTKQDGTEPEESQKSPSPSESAEEPHQPPPAPSIKVYQVFGQDPSTFPDPTIYEIKEVTEDTPEDEKKAIFGVSHYPPSDLHDLTAGTPPDKDFSNAKPTSQVAAQTFLNFAEPYTRPLTQEDLSFLTERGDRMSPFEIPKKGARHYKEIWAEEDGQFLFDSAMANLPANEGRGSIDMIGDDMLDSELISVGPVTSRWLALLYPVSKPADENPVKEDEMEIDGEPPSTQENSKQIDVPVASAFPESTWKNVTHQQAASEFPALDTRLVDELRHIGFLGPAELPSYTDVQDDEVTARLRYLQRELKRVSLTNGARKARLLEIANDRMAVQEWQGISDDLDNQLNQAYLKRTRNIGKGKKQIKRPLGTAGVAHSAGVARAGGAGLGEPIRSLMERRQQWNDLIGPVVDFGNVSIPKSTLFDKSSMERLEKIEHENWIEETEDA